MQKPCCSALSTNRFLVSCQGRRSKRICSVLILGNLVLIGFLVIFGIVIISIFAIKTDNTGFDSHGSDYALYKNTRFKDCYNTPLSNITYDCSTVREYLSPANETDNGVIAFHKPTLSLPNSATGVKTNFSLCEIVSCLSDFKVIPSTPRPSALWPTALEVGTKVAVIVFFSFLELKFLRSAMFTNTGSSCQGIRWYNWCFIAWDFISYIWWCVGMGRFATLPKNYPFPSMIGWISLWKYCYTINYHPFACALKGSPKQARIIKLILYPLAIIQWAASV
ncbi:hypothetical protein PENSTE_c001G03202 [Penicillium steckii]|uniref:Uncharacterized protein n=1 Tax=Penicillium steckii TaxID=303698 RepID=A0A1V6U327_9EURO|nr:hypothetical protein PENSTE_c001G03202 [Penicillium steckii]